uniref:Uncharacterized protein n=1 Tax=viral metagenome TaxID=1070528 RepID=A0A6M3IHY1_9ZZZZ
MTEDIKRILLATKEKMGEGEYQLIDGNLKKAEDAFNDARLDLHVLLVYIRTARKEA